MHDANDAESMDDDYYSGDTAVEYSEDDDDGDDDGDYEFDNDSVDSDDVSTSRRQQVKRGEGRKVNFFFFLIRQKSKLTRGFLHWKFFDCCFVGCFSVDR